MTSVTVSGGGEEKHGINSTGEDAYRAYVAIVDFFNFQDKPMAPWSELSKKIKAAWTNATTPTVVDTVRRLSRRMANGDLDLAAFHGNPDDLATALFMLLTKDHVLPWLTDEDLAVPVGGCHGGGDHVWQATDFDTVLRCNRGGERAVVHRVDADGQCSSCANTVHWRQETQQGD